MIDKYMEDYYLLKISLKEICEKEDISQATFYRQIKKKGYIPRRTIYGKINTGIKELDQKLKAKYTAIAKRCNGGHTDNYEGLPYLNLIEWVDFCNNRKDILLKMWNEYLESDRDRKKSISIDRIDNDKGYLLTNIEFVTFGYNAWKRNIRPINVEFNGEHNYFLSCEEASKYYGITRTYIGKSLNKDDWYDKRYIASKATIDKVLRENNVSDLKEYYNKMF
jgi:hypothetical protein